MSLLEKIILLVIGAGFFGLIMYAAAHACADDDE
jgi:hypothetical protein